jgi:hypothetical protein
MEDTNYFMKYNDRELRKYYKSLTNSYLKDLLKSRNIKYSILDFKAEYIHKLLKDDQDKRYNYAHDLKIKHSESGKLGLRQGKYKQEDLVKFLELYQIVVQYDLDSIHMHSKNDKPKNLDKLLDNIDIVYWLYEESPDNLFSSGTFSHTKNLLCKLKNGKYVYIEVHSDFFDYNNPIKSIEFSKEEPDTSISFWVDTSKNPLDLLKRMYNEVYYYYFKTTKPIKN